MMAVLERSTRPGTAEVEVARMNDPRSLTVTQPDLPPLEEFLPLLRQVWHSRQLTNGGPFHSRFESALAEYLDVPHVSLFTNATIALVTALQSLRVGGEVITTPYSFVATAHSLLWNGITPVFVDIDPVTLNLDPQKVEAAITPRTSAILAVHCYGTPCDTAALERIAADYDLKVIYDAAHAFGIRQGGRSVLAHGDLSVLSFHATKVFNTFEGGAIISPNARRKQHIDHLKNFGFANETTVVATGINGKMNEFSAALGLLQLQHVDASISRRGAIAQRYRAHFRDTPGIRLLDPPSDANQNHGYFPILVDDDFGVTRDALYQHLRRHGVLSRRYFFPLISDFSMYRGLPSADSARLPVARDMSRRVLCLPIYPALADHEVDCIAELVATARVRLPLAA
jgi:dTDP-4-amino-4,6-dideoxygalactose transaminase